MQPYFRVTYDQQPLHERLTYLQPFLYNLCRHTVLLPLSQPFLDLKSDLIHAALYQVLLL